MKFAEVIYETGAKSIVSYNDEDTLVGAIAEQHRRALNGEDAGPQLGRPAERVSRVLLYDEHPANFNEASTVSTEALSALVNKKAVGGLVSKVELEEALTKAVSPLVDQGSESGTARHDSLYKMPEVSELSPKLWDGENL